jgi:hypothetical protein
MCNIMNKKSSHSYEQAKRKQIKQVIKMTQDPERCAKISKALTGRPKSAEHIAKLIGHEVTAETREKLRQANLGKKHSLKTKKKMSKSRTGVKKRPNTKQAKINIALSNMLYVIKSPWGKFDTFIEFADAISVHQKQLRRIYARLDVVPRSKILNAMQLENPEKLTWRQLGFRKVKRK